MIDFSTLKELLIDGIKLVELYINGILVWKSGPKNWVKHSINADGTIYNNGLGYKNGYRVRSGGAEAAASEASCIGFIPVKGGDIVRLSGWDFSLASAENSINAANSAFSNIGQFTTQPANYGIFNSESGDYNAYGVSSVVEEKTGVWRWIVPPAASGVAYIRVTGHTNGDGSNMIVTVNEEIV